MKTSLIIDDKIFEDAKNEADKTGKTISEVISKWAHVGREFWKKEQKNKHVKQFKPRSLGKPMIDLTNRKNWMEELENDGN
ncbi:MAG: hypothetical protein ACK5WZ_06260 [Pseudobdellovibrionaceae bacterium]|jgi:hypothetical protein